MVNIFLRAIYRYDDRMTLIINGGDRPITVDDILLDEIEEHFESVVSGYAGCLPLVSVAPPTNPNTFDAMRVKPHGIKCFGLFRGQKSAGQTIDEKRG